MTFTAILPLGGAGHGCLVVEVQGGPCRFIDVGFQGAFELVKRLIGSREVSVANKETFAIVVGADEPAGDIVRRMAANLAGRWVVDIHALDFDDEFSGLCLSFGVRWLDAALVCGGAALVVISRHRSIVVVVVCTT